MPIVVEVMAIVMDKKIAIGPGKFVDFTMLGPINSDDGSEIMYRGLCAGDRLFTVYLSKSNDLKYISFGQDHHIYIKYNDNEIESVTMQNDRVPICVLDYEKQECVIGKQAEEQTLYYDTDLDGRTDYEKVFD
jgi:hypothetical protein